MADTVICENCSCHTPKYPVTVDLLSPTGVPAPTLIDAAVGGDVMTTAPASGEPPADDANSIQFARPPAAYPGFYRRPLPSTCVQFSSKEGKTLFLTAVQSGTAECYFKLAQVFNTQSEPAYCGLGTCAMILNALELDPGRLWRGPWRWYTEELLGCCKSLELVKTEGITIDEFKCVASCNGAKVKVYRADKSTLEEFRQVLLECCVQDQKFLAVSYSRATLDQTGDGHFSPIGGYSVEHDKVLVLDVARFKYPPYWVSVELLWQAMLPCDSVTGKSRGYFVMSRGVVNGAIFSEFFGVSGRVLAKFVEDVSDGAEQVPAQHDLTESLQAYVHVVCESMPSCFISTLRSFDTQRKALADKHREMFDRIVTYLRTTEVFSILSQCPAFNAKRWDDEHATELATLLIVASLSSVRKCRLVDDILAADILKGAPKVVQDEAKRMATQFTTVSVNRCHPC